MYRILLLENISSKAVQILEQAGWEVEQHTKALSPSELMARIKSVHFIGIRSKTKMTREILEHAENLLGIGCFCIGTNQVDLEAATERGVTL